MKFILLDEQTVTPRVVDIEPTLDNYYKYLDCELVEIVYRKIGGKEYLIICDEEGLLKNRFPVAITFEDGEVLEFLVGSVLIGAMPDWEGSEKGLSEDEINDVLCTENYKLFFLQREGSAPYPRKLMLTKVA